MSLVNTFFPRDDTTEAWYRAYSVYQSLQHPSRNQWVKTREYIISSIAYSVGLANAWRFAFVAYTSGSGGMILPYIILIFTIGVPLLTLESLLGQFTASSPVSAFNFSVISRGIGVSMGAVSWLLSIYSIMFIVYPIKYLFLTLEVYLPWTVCPTDIKNICISITEFSTFNLSSCPNVTTEVDCPLVAANVFWHNKVLGTKEMTSVRYRSVLTGAINDEMGPSQLASVSTLGAINWDKFILLAFSWGLIFLCTVSGVRGTSRVSSVSFAYSICSLLILLLAMSFQPGAVEGLKFFLYRIWINLIWTEAGIQAIMTFGLCTGGQILLSSFNKFDNAVHKHIALIASCCFVYTMITATTLFCAIGNLAYIMKVKVEEVSICLYLWKFLVIIQEETCDDFLNVVTSVIHEEIERLKNHYSKIRLAICVVSFAIGISCVTQGGIYVVEFLNECVPHITLSGIGLCELVFLACSYGVTRFFLDINFMLNFSPAAPLAVVWILFCPIVFLILFTVDIYDLFTSSLYPPAEKTMSRVLSFLILLPIPLGIVYAVIRHATKRSWKDSLHPDTNWGPRDTPVR
uniref:Sodium-dependent nutrient amino acid transporter 1 n=1 Tax=Strigamia maritima TaxID=126957 RepID=T1J0A6_STRMM